MNKYREQSLLFFISSDNKLDVKSKLNSLIEELGIVRKWVISPPVMVDEVLDHRTREEDQVEILIGGILRMYAAIDPIIPRELDVAQYYDFEFLVSTLQKFSEKENLVFEFEIDGEYVGEVDCGIPDRSMSVGMLSEWRRNLGLK